MAIDLDTVVARGSEHVETEMGDQTVMMNISQGQYYALDQSGQRIWALMDQPIRVSDIVSKLTDEYDVERAQCETEVLAFLTELQSNGLLAVEAA